MKITKFLLLLIIGVLLSVTFSSKLNKSNKSNKSSNIDYVKVNLKFLEEASSFDVGSNVETVDNTIIHLTTQYSQY